jgi:hypothetical protein
MIAVIATEASARCRFPYAALGCTELTATAEITGVVIKKDPVLCVANLIGFADADRLTNKPGNSLISSSHIWDPDTLPEAVTNVTRQDLVEQGKALVYTSWSWDETWQWVALGLGAPNRNWRPIGTNCIDDIYVGFYIWQESPKELLLNDSHCLKCTTGCREAWENNTVDYAYCSEGENCISWDGTDYTDCDPNNSKTWPDGETDCVAPPPEGESNLTCAEYNSGYGLDCIEVAIEACRNPLDSGINLELKCEAEIF